MSDPTLKEKLQPSLLDRLIDDAPRETVESRTERVQTIRDQRSSVLRDLQWLMNTENLESVNNLKNYPNVSSSVLNYGMPSLAGTSMSMADITTIERSIAEAITDFEPRIIGSTLKVRATYSEDNSSANSLVFEIEGDLYANPIPLKMFLRTQVDLETGEILISPLADV